MLLINTSRSSCVDEPVLGVLEHEPLTPDSPLRSLGDKVLLSPHMVSSNVGSGPHPGIRWATDSVLCALRGEVPDNVYNTEGGPALAEPLCRQERVGREA
jgi:phosphoglycerate dehydrogenase-like enzyme